MKKQIIGIGIGFLIGILDLVPMILQKLTWDANLSAWIMWIIIGYLYTVTDINIKPYLKGILLAFLVLVPSGILIGWNEPMSLLPIVLMTIILGALLGTLLEWALNRIRN